MWPVPVGRARHTHRSASPPVAKATLPSFGHKATTCLPAYSAGLKIKLSVTLAARRASSPDPRQLGKLVAVRKRRHLVGNMSLNPTLSRCLMNSPMAALSNALMEKMDLMSSLVTPGAASESSWSSRRPFLVIFNLP